MQSPPKQANFLSYFIIKAGCQGWFMHGWGYTADHWVAQLEIVTADWEVVIASKTQNADPFWAAPGSGRGFFGVITRIWIKIIPARKLYDMTIIVDSTKIFKAVPQIRDRGFEEGPEIRSGFVLCHLLRG